MLIKNALKKLEKASELLFESKNDIDKARGLLNEIDMKQRFKHIKPLCKQGELFLNAPVYDEKAFRSCLGALVETITDLSDIGNSRPVRADKNIQGESV
jgi:hypothetical protein